MNKNTAKVFTLVIASILSLGLAQATLAKGPPNQVSVTAANPPDAFQGEVVDVIVSGSGFDAGSTISYLVTGTTDDTQVDVISVEYVSDTELKTRIRPKDAALATDYDIEVQNSTGRKGKGTTLFKVKQAEVACSGFQSMEPEIAYLTGVDTSGELYSQDIYLSTASGCDQYLLLEDAALSLPVNGDPNQDYGEELADVTGLRLDIEGNHGVVVWRDTAIRPIPLLALRFDVDINGGVIVDPSGPEVIHLPPENYNAYGADVRLNALGEIELITVEYAPDKTEWRLVYVNVDSGTRTQLSAGGCPFQDASGLCFQPSYAYAWWNDDGNEVYFNPNTMPDAESAYVALARISRIAGAWQPVEILMKNDAQINVIGIRPDGLLAYEWLHSVPRKKGRTTFMETNWIASSLDPDDCVELECAPEDGQQMAADANKFPRGWTRAGGMLFMESGPGAQWSIWEYSDPFNGVVGELKIEDVDRGERDTTY